MEQGRGSSWTEGKPSGGGTSIPKLRFEQGLLQAPKYTTSNPEANLKAVRTACAWVKKERLKSRTNPTTPWANAKR
jgi:hypothetical protein